MAKRNKVHPEYFKIKGYQILARVSDEKAADALGICTRTYREKRDGYSDFSLEQGRLLSELLGQSQETLFSCA